MHHDRRSLALLGAVLLVLSGLLAPVGTASASGRVDRDVRRLRAATRDFRSLDVAQAAGYTNLVIDVNGLSCIAEPGVGAMGVHYLEPALIDDAIDVTHPEVLVYEPRDHGRLRLGAVEYLVFQEAWDATHASPPGLFGHEFMLVPSPNRYGVPAFYMLHAWVWRHNPDGMFASWNPKVDCDEWEEGNS